MPSSATYASSERGKPQADAIAAPHSPAAKKPRQLVGPALQLAVGQPLVGADQGDAVRAGIGLVLEQLVQQLRPQQVGVGVWNG